MVQSMNSTQHPLVLVTGATGLVGAHLTAALLIKGYAVRATKRNSSSLAQFQYIMQHYGLDATSLPLEWVDADLFDTKALAHAMQQVHYLFHCAADVNLTAGSESQLLKTNIEGTNHIIEAAMAAHVRKACFVSSIAALGHSTPFHPITEETPIDHSKPRSAYGRSKLAVESLITDANALGLPSVIVNPGVVLGVTNRNESSSKIIFLCKKGLPFSTSGSSGYVDVRDLCQAMIALTESPNHGERYIVVGANPTQHQLIALLNQGFGHRAPLCMPNAIIKAAGSMGHFCNTLFKTNIPFDRQMAQTSMNRTTYSSDKLLSAIPFTFTPLEETIGHICRSMN